MEKAMDDPRQGMPTNEQDDNDIVTGVEKMNYDQGSGYGFSLLDEESRAPCFRLVFQTQQDAQHARSMMVEMMNHAVWYEVPDEPAAPAGQGGWSR